MVTASLLKLTIKYPLGYSLKIQVMEANSRYLTLKLNMVIEANRVEIYAVLEANLSDLISEA